MKARTGKSWARVATAGAALGALTFGLPAQAQFPVANTETGGEAPSAPADPNAPPPTPPRRQFNYVSVSPYTVFQFVTPNRNGTTGEVTTTKSTKVGPFFQYERDYEIERKRSTSVSLGAWYWYHGGSDNERDRFAVYSTYNFSRQFGLEVNAGGTTNVGFTEYYGFGLYRYALPNAPHPHLSLIQVGVGPYFPRSGYGNTGYTATLGGLYTLSKAYSVTASVWYVNYDAPARDFGSNFVTHDSLTRFNLGVVYNF